MQPKVPYLNGQLSACYLIVTLSLTWAYMYHGLSFVLSMKALPTVPSTSNFRASSTYICTIRAMHPLVYHLARAPALVEYFSRAVYICISRERYTYVFEERSRTANHSMHAQHLAIGFGHMGTSNQH